MSRCCMPWWSSRCEILTMGVLISLVTGLAELSLGTKLGLCEKLGLSPVASIALLQDLDVVTQVRLNHFTISSLWILAHVCL